MEKNCFLCVLFSDCCARVKRMRDLFIQGEGQVLENICGGYQEDDLMKNRKEDAELLRGIISGTIAEIEAAKTSSELIRTLSQAAKEHQVIAILRINLNGGNPVNDSYLIQGIYRDMEQARISTAGMCVTFIDPAKMLRF